MVSNRTHPEKLTALENALRDARPAFGFVIFLGFFINLLAFVSPLYMLQIYDRVIMSRNMTTLLMLTLIAAALLVSYALLEMSRSRILVRAGILFDKKASDTVFNTIQRASIANPGGGPAQGLRDLDRVREFLTGNGLVALCDAPWVPIFILGCFILHPWYGYVAVSGAAAIFILALLNDVLTRNHLQEGSRSAISANNYASTTLRNAEVTRAMGMLAALRKRWKMQHDQVLDWQASASDRAGAVMALSKFTRMLLQIAILGTGAYLVVNKGMSAGHMVAASILMGRALAPVEQSVGNWRNLIGTRDSYLRLNALLKSVRPEAPRMSLPTPVGALSVEQLFAGPPKAEKPILQNVTFDVSPGESIGILGQSGAGKSTLARVLVGVWPYMRGAVRLDGAELPHWDPDELGRHIGYLPQDVELFSGTIAENISRFDDGDVEAEEKIITAAKMAGVHEMIQKLPEGYNTQIGEGGHALSGGQRQRVGLARAVYGEPAFIMLDEPNSNLDTAGEAALAAALSRLKEAGKTVILVTHKANIVANVDKLLVINDGLVKFFGPREQVMAQLTNSRVVPLQNPQPQAFGAASAKA
jgi:ATP-binding cassette subfamily C protein